VLKTTSIELSGGDAGRTMLLKELPALVADRFARELLEMVDADPDGGVVALAYRHTADVRKLGDVGLRGLNRFVHVIAGGTLAQTADDLRDWRNVERVQQAALLLHVGFLQTRKRLDIPVYMQVEQMLSNTADIKATFCSPTLAAVLQSGKASYVELETVLSTEDVFNIVEILNVEALRTAHSAKD